MYFSKNYVIPPLKLHSSQSNSFPQNKRIKQKTNASITRALPAQSNKNI